MKVNIKRFNVDMEIKTSGIEFEVRTPSGKDHLGDLVLTKSNLIWCRGRTHFKNGKKMKWEDFIEMMETDA